ncbi:xanthine dehydrogenase family protein molybdopterin-binding subunit [Nocardia fusca]|uniref:xanthine dehydrogenase family protein molybdopterin-binding subunit n=1 Tax=Nocardia fusca TaxID=941183 RepID=UPI003797310C
MTAQPQVAVGTALSRVDGRLKVTGKATFAAEHAVEGVVHAVLVTATVGRGRITGIDSGRALAESGVLAVISHLDAPKLAFEGTTGSSLNPEGQRLPVFQDDRVRFFGQPVAVVVADTLETAQYAAHLVAVRYQADTPSMDLTTAQAGQPELYSRGNAEQAFQQAEVRLDATYRTARNNHNPMELHATIAAWDGDRLTVWDKTQFVVGTQSELADVFGLAPDAVRVVSPFVGGGFGSALRTWPHVIAAAIAARTTRRPVKLALTRPQMFSGTGLRAAYEQRFRLGAQRDGRITALIQDVRGETSTYESKFTEAILPPAQMMYAIPDVRQGYQTVPLDIPAATWMRGPGMSTSNFGLDSALDELAHELGIDPIAMRVRNEPEVDPSTEQPFTTRRLRECYTVGAREFGWNQRNPVPGSTREGDWMIGLGMAAGVYDPGRMASSARARLQPDGIAVVEAAASDMGPGTYTSLTQVAADALGLPVENVRVRLGDSLFPPTPPHGGSMTMVSVGTAVQNACDTLRAHALELAVHDQRSPLHGADPAALVVDQGRVRVANDPSRGETYQQLLTRNGAGRLEATGSYAPDTNSKLSYYAYNATFAEVAVDSRLGLVRVRRLLGVYDAGRIVNPKLAESQALGGMVGGIGQALLEHTVTDDRDGRLVNNSLADYLVPVNADINELRAIYLDGDDRAADPLGVKGLGEVVICGVAPAIANAVFNATGRRIRDLPITAEALL